jgi:hypothetical protein
MNPIIAMSLSAGSGLILYLALVLALFLAMLRLPGDSGSSE